MHSMSAREYLSSDECRWLRLQAALMCSGVSAEYFVVHRIGEEHVAVLANPLLGIDALAGRDVHAAVVHDCELLHC
jgi:hypothetical protein